MSSKIVELGISALLLVFSIYLAFQEKLNLPGRASMNMYQLDRPWTYFIAVSVASFALALGLLAINKEKYIRIGGGLFISSFILFGVGFLVGAK